jgi:mRNA-degrading endonuclease toxin of MazEF toxin-antitoxin module
VVDQGAAPIPERGEVWNYLPTIAGRSKPSALSGDRVLVLSRGLVNSALPTVLAVPLEDAPRMPGLAVLLSDADPLPGLSVVTYRITPLYRGWLVDRVGMLTQPTLRQVFAALVGLISE